jgi:hypothetical protein
VLVLFNDIQLSQKPRPSHVTVSDSAGEDTDDQSEIQEEEKCCNEMDEIFETTEYH